MSYQGKSRSLLAVILLAAGLLSACGGGNSSKPLYSGSVKPTPKIPISQQTLDSAASFLGAATGKESPISVDTVVFINSVLGLNNVPSDPQNLYGDLWLIARDASGVPILDHNGCVQPIASEPVTWPDGLVGDTVPMELEEFMDGDFKCTVVEGYEQYTIELDIGRLNMVRNMANNPNGFARALEEAINTINSAVEVSTDPAGRLLLTVEESGVLVEKTIDSPRENLALYHALLKYGRIAGYGPERRSAGQVVPPQWLEIDPDLDLGKLAYLRDSKSGGIKLANGYADFSSMTHSRQEDYQSELISYVQYIDGASCPYWDLKDLAWSRVFDEVAYYGNNIDAFATHADDARRTIVFMHDVIQDAPETELATLPTPAGNRIGAEHAAAAFLGGASNKTVPLTVDGLVFINTVLGLNNVEFTYKGEIFGDLWQLVRNDNGEPVLDGNSCPQPVASEPVLWPDDVERDTVPMELDDQGECVIVEGYEDYVVEIELGRLNGVRVALTNPKVLNRHLYDVVNSINASEGVKLDLAGRLAYGVMEEGELVYKTVDSPRAGLAMYWAMMQWGKLEGQIEIMEDGSWVTKNIAITLDDATLDAEELGYLKHGNAACQSSPSNCGASRLPSGYVDYSGFSHNTQAVYDGVDVDFVERTPDDLTCGYADRTEGLWERVLGSDPYDDTNIGAFVKQAEDTRTVVEFIHTTIHDPVTAP